MMVATGISLVFSPDTANMRGVIIIETLLFLAGLIFLIRSLLKPRMPASQRATKADTAAINQTVSVRQQREHPPTGLVSVECKPTDTDETIGPLPGTELSYLDAEALKFWAGKKTDFVIPAYYKDTAFGRNVGPALERLLSEGYLDFGSTEKRIALKTVPEIKAILADYELKTTGKKAELVQRVINNLSLDEIEEAFPVQTYELTAKGENALRPYSVLNENRNYGLGLSSYRLLSERGKSPDENDYSLIQRLLKEDIDTCLATGDHAKCQQQLANMAMFFNGHGDTEKALDCYIISFFLWSREYEAYHMQSISAQSEYMAKQLERYGQLCGLTIGQLISRMGSVCRDVNPFELSSNRNINYAVSLFNEALHIGS